jgi:hypothetical protein
VQVERVDSERIILELNGDIGHFVSSSRLAIFIQARQSYAEGKTSTGKTTDHRRITFQI